MNLIDTTTTFLTWQILTNTAGLSGNAEAPNVELWARATERAFEKLRPNLSRVLGSNGYAVLLRRAVAISQTDSVSRTTIQVENDGTLTGLTAAATARSNEFTDADNIVQITTLTEQFVHLLETFIGADLTLRLLRDVWPTIGEAGGHAAEPNGSVANVEERSERV